MRTARPSKRKPTRKEDPRLIFGGRVVLTVGTVIWVLGVVLPFWYPSIWTILFTWVPGVTLVVAGMFLLMRGGHSPAWDLFPPY